ncbi:MAG TPA: alpha/beta hydrolase [Gaiellaceae bacterium]|nr:alpha/beta hydrolase [Gaiellaceae bacterium]
MRIRVGDVRLYVEIIGERLVPDGPAMHARPTMILLHGGPGFDHNSLRPHLAPLADVAQLVFVDQRGQGRSDASAPDRWNLDVWIDDVAGLCDVLGIEKPVVFGHSFGGMVALGIAIRHPDLPGKLIVSNSAAKFRPDRALDMFERLGGGEARSVAEAFLLAPELEQLERFMAVCYPLYGPAAPDPEVRARIVVRPDVTLHFFQEEINRYDWFPLLARIACPTLILAGELDPITPVAGHEEMAEAIAGAELRVFESAGHAPFRDRPDDALGAIRAFVLG